MQTQEQVLPAGRNKLLQNNGSVVFFNDDCGRRVCFPEGWMADGVRQKLGERMPKVKEIVNLSKPVVVQK